MPFIPFPEYRPDVDDFRGQHTQVLRGVVPRGDGYGPMASLLAFTEALPGTCRGFGYARKGDGTIVVFAATADRIFRLDNSTLGWVPVSKVVALTSISNDSPAEFTLAGHGLSDGDALVLSTTGTLPTGLTVGTVYYVVNATTSTFNVSETPGGMEVDTTGAGTGTHSMTYVYTPVASTDQWRFEQFGDYMVAVQGNTAPQVFDLGSGTAFEDLAGSPPNARYVAVVGRFLILAGLISTPNRVQWCALDDITEWTPGTSFAGYYDLPDGGIARGVAGGEFGLVCQESVIRRLTYVPGATPAFQIERITEDLGLLGPYSIARAGNRVFFVTQIGFYEYSPGGGLKNIGKEKVDRSFLETLDVASLQLLIGASDPANTRVFWGYKTGSGDQFNKMIGYDYVLERWSPPLDIAGDYLAPLVRPGITLENVDTLFGNDIDALTFSLDSIQSALTSRIAAFNSDHELCFFGGPNLEATLETPEQSLEGRRVRVKGLEPRTDAATVYGSVRYRSNAQSTLQQSAETLVNTHGMCPQNIDTKLVRGRARIPAGTNWTFIMGVEPVFAQTGKR
jgi:hypothetical protein